MATDETGQQLWIAGVIAAKYLIDHPELTRGKVVFDLGGGQGVTSSAALTGGAEMVVFCDLRENIESDFVRRLTGQLNASSNKFVPLPWDWTICFGTQALPVSLRQEIDKVTAAPEGGIVVIASDLFYQDDQIDDVLSSVWTFLKLCPSKSWCLALIPHRTVDWSLGPFLDRWGMCAEVVDISDYISEMDSQDSRFLQSFGDDFTTMTCLKITLLPAAPTK
eukprot:TRINITY_DN28730_c0_g1_i1.p1 TRINITY_DN28730_c0_g1~~TRINITY_DN28730_c0_g1_i1.p1  ORF type:complete len:236 (+),score=41.14 TRINITY_DN28730_c0_g1_i1:47-709(+)